MDEHTSFPEEIPSGQKLDQSLTDEEYDRLQDHLGSFEEERAMNLEEMDGFFAALICGPRAVPPSEYLNEIWGSSEPSEEWAPFDELDEFKDFLTLAMRHWNHVAQSLQSGEIFRPMLFSEEGEDMPKGHDWARGFVRGMAICPEDWDALTQDEEESSALIPVFALMDEQMPDAELLEGSMEKISDMPREELLAYMIASTMHIYQYFRPQRERQAALRGRPRATVRRTMPKMGRNDPCPCGSGKKYKRCCGAATIQ